MSRIPKYAWKVVWVKNKQLTSAVSCFPVRYYKTRWTYPPKEQGGHPWLFVFRTRHHARNFCQWLASDGWAKDFLVFKCHVKNLTQPIRSYINDFGRRRLTSPLMYPDGTLFADAVKLIK